MHLYKIISARLCMALTAIVKFHICSKKWLGTNKILRAKRHTGSKFSKISLRLLCTGGTSCAPILLLWPQIQNRMF